MGFKNTEKKKKSSMIIPNIPAIALEEEIYGKTLIIADLHLGFLYLKNKKGIIVPYDQTPEADLCRLVEKIGCKRLIIIGDFKDEIYGGSNPLAGRIWELSNQLLSKTKVTLLKGNHDGRIEELTPDGIEILAPSGLIIKEVENNYLIGLWHGHAIPKLDLLNCDITISGHVHPAYSYKDQIGAKNTEKVWLKTSWKNKKGTHIIMPAFNRYIEGVSVDEENFKESLIMQEAIDYENAEVFTLDGVLLGTVSELKKSRTLLEEKILLQRGELGKIKKKKSWD